ncbi:hypothetical protein IJ103_00175 [Candidatus Saccharibacteria bacterium]|nr:hypothetical protein [Candidatus Saccharibacteria bacterium]
MKDSRVSVIITPGAVTSLKLIDVKTGAPLGRIEYPSESAATIASAILGNETATTAPAGTLSSESEGTPAPRKRAGRPANAKKNNR